MIRFNDIAIDRATSTITVGAKVCRFKALGRPSPYSRYESQLFEAAAFLILNGWTRKQQLWDHLFADDPEGGPNAGLSIIDIKFCQWRPRLAKLGLAIVREKRGGIVWYKIVLLKESSEYSSLARKRVA